MKTAITLVTLALFALPPAARAQAACADGIPTSQTRVFGSQGNLMSWPITTCMQSVTFDMNPDTGSFPPTFDRQNGPNRWPDVTPTGFTGPIEYSYGMCLRNPGDGAWDCSAPIQMWNGRVETDPGSTTPPDRVGQNWFYNSSWGPLMDRNPSVGEQVGLFVCRGNCRLVSGTSADPPGTLAERSNVALVTWGTPWAQATQPQQPQGPTQPQQPQQPQGPSQPQPPSQPWSGGTLPWADHDQLERIFANLTQQISDLKSQAAAMQVDLGAKIDKPAWFANKYFQAVLAAATTFATSKFGLNTQTSTAVSSAAASGAIIAAVR